MPYGNRSMYYGDPGFFGGLLKGIGKVAKFAGKVGKVVPGIGTAISAIELGSGLGNALAKGPLSRIGLPRGVTVMPGGSNTGIVGPNLPRIPGAGGVPAQSFGRRIPGSSTGFPSTGRRYRRMNVGNVRALRRSMRRVQGFAKLARQTITFTSHVKMKKRRTR